LKSIQKQRRRNSFTYCSAVGLISCVLVSGCAPQASTDANSQSATEMNSSVEFELSEIERQELEVQALSGDPNSAYKLARYYSELPTAQDKAIVWFRASAERDHEPGTYELALALANRSQGGDCAEAMRWAAAWATLKAAKASAATVMTLPRERADLETSIELACQS
jgi:TPR repeat protein